MAGRAKSVFRSSFRVARYDNGTVRVTVERLEGDVEFRARLTDFASGKYKLDVMANRGPRPLDVAQIEAGMQILVRKARSDLALGQGTQLPKALLTSGAEREDDDDDLCKEEGCNYRRYPGNYGFCRRHREHG